MTTGPMSRLTPPPAAMKPDRRRAGAGPIMGATARPTSLTTARTRLSRAATKVRPRSAELERTRKESGSEDAVDVPADRDLVRARVRLLGLLGRHRHHYRPE